MPSVNKQTIVEYNGNLLEEQDATFLKKLESLIQKPIPRISELVNETAGYVVEDKRITSLGLYDLQLEHLPTEIGNLTNLRWLWIDNNNLTTFPESIGNLSNLTFLTANGNCIETLPSSFRNLINLRELELNYNKLQILPESVCHLTKLHTLAIDNNHISHLPEAIGQLSNLESLNINDNELTTLPLGMTNLKKVKFLNMMHNHFLELPPKVEEWLNGIMRLLRISITKRAIFEIGMRKQTPMIPLIQVIPKIFSGIVIFVVGVLFVFFLEVFLDFLLPT